MPLRMILAPHPRLYASRKQLERLRVTPDHPLLAAAARKVARDAAEYVLGAAFTYNEATHNAHLIRARMMQNRIVTLLVERFRTGRPRCRDAVVRHVEELERWTHWSWIAARKNQNHPNDIFDLSYGENSATLAIAYDWLYDALSKPERARLVELARRRALIPFLKNTGKKTRAWWFGKPDSNWNTVCAGGAGMLALAMYEEAPEAREVLKRAEVSIAPYLRHLQATSGGWPEGIGYWNYGMRYAFMYLLSHENATGRRHAGLRQPATKASLYFPFDFCPQGVPASFGDVNSWSPLPFHYAVAERLGCRDLLAQLDEASTRAQARSQLWPDAAELLVFHPRKAPLRVARPVAAPCAKLYRGLDWGILADRWPAPNLYLSIRGGTTKVPHSHRDLLSFHLVADGEKMVHNIGVEEYLDSTFGSRRFELFETMPASKNTLLINGVGISGDSTVKTELVRRGGLRGIRIDATEAMGKSRDGNAAAFCGRLFLLLGADAALLVDRIETKFPARMETRLHTQARVKLGKDGALLTGQRAKLGVAYASNVPSVLCTAQVAPTLPGKGASLLRWCTKTCGQTAVTFATLFARGAEAAEVRVRVKGQALRIETIVGKRTISLLLSARL